MRVLVKDLNSVLMKIRNQNELTKILQSDKSWRVREACVKKIVSIKVLKEVSLNDENEYVRNVAKNRMKALFEVTSWKKYLLILVAIVSFVLVIYNPFSLKASIKRKTSVS